MVTYLEMAVAEAKRKTQVRDAEQWRLAQEAKAGRDPRRSTRSRVLSWTGDRLVGAGLYLQNRFGECVDAAQTAAQTAAQEACTCGQVDTVPTAW